MVYKLNAQEQEGRRFYMEERAWWVKDLLEVLSLLDFLSSSLEPPLIIAGLNRSSKREKISWFSYAADFKGANRSAFLGQQAPGVDPLLLRRRRRRRRCAAASALCAVSRSGAPPQGYKTCAAPQTSLSAGSGCDPGSSRL